MAIPRERRGVPRPTAGGVEASRAGRPTSSALSSPRTCAGRATPLARGTLGPGAAALLALALGACEPYLEGSGVYFEEVRENVPPFVGLHVEDGIQAVVTAQATAQRVLVTGDARVVPYIHTDVKVEAGRAVLRVFIEEQFDRTIPPGVVLEVPSFEYVSATQGARVRVGNAGTATFEVVADQASAVQVSGVSGVDPAGETIEVALASGAALDATRYPVSSAAAVDLGGASTARLHSDGPVTGTVSNASMLDNTYGTGHCLGVVKDTSSTVTCPSL